MKILVILALIACVAAYKGAPRRFRWKMEPRFTDEDKIVGGSPAEKTEFPFIVSLRKESLWWGASHICGGSIISSNRVLTAAHCTVDGGNFEVAGGQYRKDSDSDDNEQIITVSDAVEHSSYDTRTLNNDFSVLKLSSSFKYDAYVKKIELGACSDGDMVTVAGWGATSEGGSSSNVLLKLEVPVIATSKCNAPSAYGGKITAQMICAGYLNKAGEDSCQGDSGGPLVSRSNQLVGVVSWGQGCARLGYPGVYARVTSAQSWIKSV